MAKKLTDAAKVIDVKHRIDKLLTAYKEHYSRGELIGRSIDALTDMYAILDAETDDKIAMAVVKAELLQDVVKTRSRQGR